MFIERRPQSELLALRDEYEKLMHEADRRAYELTYPAWPARLLDFPLGVPVSYLWTGFWESPEAGRRRIHPNITIATSSMDDVETLRERLGVDRPSIEMTSIDVSFAGRATVADRSFAMLETGQLVAEFVDDGTAVIVVGESEALLPAHVAIREMTDLRELIEEWKNL